MTRDQAEEIHRHLLDAKNAMSRAEGAIIMAAAYKTWADNLHAIAIGLNFGLLPAIYTLFPDLQPRGEVPTINSELEWSEVELPSSITESDLDELIFSLLMPQWQKMARILIDASNECKARSWLIESEVVAARIQALADDDRVDHKGDLRIWRFSEVRLKP